VEALAFDTGGERGLAVAYGAHPDRGPGWGWSILVDADSGEFTRKTAKVTDLNITGIALHARAALPCQSTIDGLRPRQATGEVRTLAGARPWPASRSIARPARRDRVGRTRPCACGAASGAEPAC
jgi:hypothetical protein